MKIQNRYEYEPSQDLLGRGGFARVYQARDTLLNRNVALKVFSNTGGHRYSVLDEIRKAIGLEHPNLLWVAPTVDKFPREVRARRTYRSHSAGRV